MQADRNYWAAITATTTATIATGAVTAASVCDTQNHGGLQEELLAELPSSTSAKWLATTWQQWATDLQGGAG